MTLIEDGGTIAAVCSRCQSQRNYEFAMDSITGRQAAGIYDSRSIIALSRSHWSGNPFVNKPTGDPATAFSHHGYSRARLNEACESQLC
jgi:hypothetical protein